MFLSRYNVIELTNKGRLILRIWILVSIIALLTTSCKKDSQETSDNSSENQNSVLVLSGPSLLIADESSTVTYTLAHHNSKEVNLEIADVVQNLTGTAACAQELSGSGTKSTTITLTSCKGVGTVGITIMGKKAEIIAGPSRTFDVDNCTPAPEQIFFASQLSLNGTFNVPSPNATWNIWSITSDGNILKPVTTFTRGQTSRIPRGSINGRYLFFYTMANLMGNDTDDLSLSANIWMIDRRYDQDFTLLTQNSKAKGLDSYSGARFDSKSKIFFDSFMDVSGEWDGTPSLSPNLFMLDEPGKNPIAITQNTKDDYDSHFDKMSPQGDKIAFLSRGDLTGIPDGKAAGPLNLWILNTETNEKKPLTRNAIVGLETRGSSFFPDGKKLVFISGTSLTGKWNGPKSQKLNVWTINTDGTGLKNLTALINTAVYSVSVTPDGKKIVFRSDMALDGSDKAMALTNIWMMDSDGSNKVPITKNTKAGHHSLPPEISPDGKRISFFSNTNLSGVWNGAPEASYNLWLANIDGTGLIPITRNSNPAMDPYSSTPHTWSAAGANCK